MGTQLKFVTKEEAHKIIDNSPGNNVLILTYDKKIGISNNGKYIKKKKGKKLVDKASVVVLTDSTPIMTLNLHNDFFDDFASYKKQNIFKSIMLANLE